jgi:tetratricopeptide (TPR) repeat protein
MGSERDKARGIRLYNAGRFAEAEAAFSSTLAAGDAAPDARALKAFCRQALGDAAGARREMKEALRRFPSSAVVCAQYSQLCLQQGRLGQALALARRAERADRTYRGQAAAVQCEMAWRHARLGEWKAALRCARASLRQDSRSESACLLEARALSNLGRPADALAALRAQPPARRGADAWCEMASAHVALGDGRAALGCAREALRRDPRSAQAGKLEAAALAALGRPREVRTALRRALGATPGDVELWTALAKVSADLGDERGSRAALVHASRRGLTAEALDSIVPSLTDKAGALRDKGRFARAGRFLRLALECLPSDPALWFEQGVLLRHQNRLAEAEAAYRKSGELRPEDLRTHLYRAEALMAAGRARDVRGVLLRARALCPLPERDDLEGWVQRYRLSASLFDYAGAARTGEALLNAGRDLRRVEGLSWPVLVDDFELVERPPDFLRRAEAELDRLPTRGTVSIWGRLLSVGFALQPGASPAFRARASAAASALARLPPARYGWMRYATGCLLQKLGDHEAALADFHASSGATRPANWLALFHVKEILLSRGDRGAALRGLDRIERLVPKERSRDFLIKKGWLLLEAGRLEAARRTFERVCAGARAPDAALGLRAIAARRAGSGLA